MLAWLEIFTLKDLDSYSQRNLCRVFNIVQENAHRAYGDVEDLNKVYNAVIKYGTNFFNLDIDLNNTTVLYNNRVIQYGGTVQYYSNIAIHEQLI